MITDFHFHNAWPQWLFIAALLVLALCLWGNRRRRAILAIFGVDRDRTSAWLRACAARRWWRAAAVVIALCLLAFAALQPRCNPDIAKFKARARDIAVLVDVSKSMLAEDLKPSRLERAKLQIARLCDHLRGDRIGLIAFAGTARIVCPLTSDTSYFKGELRHLDHRSAEQGGTQIGRAVRKAVRDLFGFEDEVDPATGDGDDAGVGETVIDEEALDDDEAWADILLITDGENHGYSPELAVQDAAKHGVGLYVVGIGSEDGTPIPVTRDDGTTEYVKYDGKLVQTRLDSDGLMEMVHAAPRGAYLPAGTDNFDLVGFFDRTLGQEEGREVFEEHVTWTELFQPFVLAGIFFYLIYLALPERPSRHRSVNLAEVREA